MTIKYTGLTGKSFPIIAKNKNEADKIVEILKPYIKTDISSKVERQIQTYKKFYIGIPQYWTFLIPTDVVCDLLNKGKLEYSKTLDDGLPGCKVVL